MKVLGCYKNLKKHGSKSSRPEIVELYWECEKKSDLQSFYYVDYNAFIYVVILYAYCYVGYSIKLY